MKNRDNLRNKALYDLMITILRRRNKLCPIEIVGERKPECVPDKDYIHSNCEQCIQNWLNAEVTS